MRRVRTRRQIAQELALANAVQRRLLGLCQTALLVRKREFRHLRATILSENNVCRRIDQAFRNPHNPAKPESLPDPILLPELEKFAHPSIFPNR